MQTKNQISLTRKALYVIMLLGVFLSAFGGGNLSPAHAQEPGTPMPEATETLIATMPTLITNADNITAQDFQLLCYRGIPVITGKFCGLVALIPGLVVVIFKRRLALVGEVAWILQWVVNRLMFLLWHQE